MALDFRQTTPSLARRLFLAIPAGIVGEVVFEILALIVAPMLLGTAMQPALLVGALAGVLTGAPISSASAWLGHLLAGAVLFPVGYVLFARYFGLRPWPLAAVIYAILLWFLAQGVLAPIVGRPFMLGFVAYTWASLAVHLIYVLVVAGTLHRLLGSPPAD
jgi:hypothetical protein